MVGNAGNAPVRRFRLCFATPDLQSGSRIISLGGPTQVVGGGGGSRAHGGEGYEPCLNLILPAVKWWSRRVRLHAANSFAGEIVAVRKDLVCHDPEMKWQAASVLPGVS